MPGRTVQYASKRGLAVRTGERPAPSLTGQGGMDLRPRQAPQSVSESVLSHPWRILVFAGGVGRWEYHLVLPILNLHDDVRLSQG